MNTPESKLILYLYDLPMSIVTSVKISDIIEKRCGYKLLEPAVFKESRPHPVTGLPSPFVKGLVKIELSELKKVAESLKYFQVDDGAGNMWNCRALPFDRDLMASNKVTTMLKQTIFVSEIPKDFTAADLEEKFKVLAPVKFCKISVSFLTVIVNRNGRNVKEVDHTHPPISNGYGFVTF